MGLIQPLTMLRFCLMLTLATLAAAGPGYKAMMMKKMAKHYFDQMCWGKDNQMAKYKSIKESLASCMGQAAPAPRAMPQKMVMKPVHSYHVPTYSIVSPYQFTRYHHLGKRATPEEETAEFLNDWVDFQGDLEHKIGNLTCVFDKMGLHTASGDVNLKFFTTDFWNNINLGSTLAGSDPAWRSMFTTKWTDCYNKAQAIPTETLTRMSFMKSMPQLARNMEFWMCAMEAKTDACPLRSSTRCWRICTARTTAPSTGPSTGCLPTSKSLKRTKVFSKKKKNPAPYVCQGTSSPA